MGIRLQKGGNVSLQKEDPTVESITVGLGWKTRDDDGDDFDLDASCFLLKDNEKVRNDSDLIFYNNTHGENDCVVHSGDDRSGGSGVSDDEVINVDLSKIPSRITKLVFTVSIYDGEKRHQNFGMIRSAYIRIVNTKSGNEILRYDLTEEASLNTAMIFGAVYRQDSAWKFKAIGEGVENNLLGLCKKYGVEVE
ncbi:MAG: TerD family protein [Desulfovibrionaceae bacterium]|nr:TerD family protein [Desulfovibrionaceae bacterium]